VIAVDTSTLVAIVIGEPEAEALLLRLQSETAVSAQEKTRFVLIETRG
jgi:uncharacterized protein with PIN domain